MTPDEIAELERLVKFAQEASVAVDEYRKKFASNCSHPFEFVWEVEWDPYTSMLRRHCQICGKSEYSIDKQRCRRDGSSLAGFPDEIR